MHPCTCVYRLLSQIHSQMLATRHHYTDMLIMMMMMMMTTITIHDDDDNDNNSGDDCTDAPLPNQDDVRKNGHVAVHMSYACNPWRTPSIEPSDLAHHLTST